MEGYDGLSRSWAQKHFLTLNGDWSPVSGSFDVTRKRAWDNCAAPWMFSLTHPAILSGQFGLHSSQPLQMQPVLIKFLRYLWPLSKTLERHFLWEFNL